MKPWITNLLLKILLCLFLHTVPAVRQWFCAHDVRNCTVFTQCTCVYLNHPNSAASTWQSHLLTSKGERDSNNNIWLYKRYNKIIYIYSSMLNHVYIHSGCAEEWQDPNTLPSKSVEENPSGKVSWRKWSHPQIFQTIECMS